MYERWKHIPFDLSPTSIKGDHRLFSHKLHCFTSPQSYLSSSSSSVLDWRPHNSPSLSLDSFTDQEWARKKREMNRCSNRRRKWRKSGPSSASTATAPSLARKRWAATRMATGGSGTPRQEPSTKLRSTACKQQRRCLRFHPSPSCTPTTRSCTQPETISGRQPIRHTTTSRDILIATILIICLTASTTTAVVSQHRGSIKGTSPDSLLPITVDMREERRSSGGMRTGKETTPPVLQVIWGHDHHHRQQPWKGHQHPQTQPYYLSHMPVRLQTIPTQTRRR